MAVLFITHPDVMVDPNIAVGRWRLSDNGITRMRTFVASTVVDAVSEVWASTETKAIEAAGFLAARFGLPVNVDADLGENDRTSTGYLTPFEFEAAADTFFAKPKESLRGWETAVAAQARVGNSVHRILQKWDGLGDLAIVAHGAVGTLLMCNMLGQEITRSLDQPFQGHYWAFDPSTRLVVHQWKSIAPR
jgi:broad specificity phosphatase PhoE